MDEPVPGPDGFDRAIRLGCGGLLGLLVGVPSAIHVWNQSHNSGLAWAVGVAGVLLFALLALRYGDRFWAWVVDSRLWWWH